MISSLESYQMKKLNDSSVATQVTCNTKCITLFCALSTMCVCICGRVGSIIEGEMADQQDNEI